MSELKVDSARVKSAAEKCPDAKRVLEELFPEAFEADFKRGDVFTYPGGTSGNKYVYLGNGRAEKEYWEAIKPGVIRSPGHLMLSLRSGELYVISDSSLKNNVKKVKE